jgi:Arc/MetJ-type ribon-helix-helix transcriptional regulator
MKTLTVRMPEALVADIEAESRGRKISKSDVIRDRLQVASGSAWRQAAPLGAIADLIGSVDDLAADLSACKKQYLRATRRPQTSSLTRDSSWRSSAPATPRAKLLCLKLSICLERAACRAGCF